MIGILSHLKPKHTYTMPLSAPADLVEGGSAAIDAALQFHLSSAFAAPTLRRFGVPRDAQRSSGSNALLYAVLWASDASFRGLPSNDQRASFVADCRRKLTENISTAVSGAPLPLDPHASTSALAVLDSAAPVGEAEWQTIVRYSPFAVPHDVLLLSVAEESGSRSLRLLSSSSASAPHASVVLVHHRFSEAQLLLPANGAARSHFEPVCDPEGRFVMDASVPWLQAALPRLTPAVFPGVGVAPTLVFPPLPLLDFHPRLSASSSSSSSAADAHAHTIAPADRTLSSTSAMLSGVPHTPAAAFSIKVGSSLSLSVCLSVCLYVFLSVRISLSVCMSVSLYLYVCVFFYLYVCLSLSICMYACLCVAHNYTQTAHFILPTECFGRV